MQILSTSGWEEYSLLDSGNSLRLEKFGPYITVRPDPQAIWQPSLSHDIWNKADVLFKRTSTDSGRWHYNTKLPEKWLMHWKNLSFWTRLTSFKHTGVFPEQSLQWEWMIQKIDTRNLKLVEEAGNQKLEKIQFPASTVKAQASIIQHPASDVSILNLFGYTGIATLAAAKAGAKVTHVDASKPTLNWAHENAEASGLKDHPIRWILDDAVKFVEKEIRRGNTYDAIIMDPPVYGHGPTGQVWKFNEDFPLLFNQITKVLSDNPLFIIVNAYAISSSSLMLQNVMEDNLKNLGGKIEVGELVLEEEKNKRPLSTGIFGRWSK